MGQSLEALEVKLARVQIHPYVAKRGKKLVPVVGSVQERKAAELKRSADSASDEAEDPREVVRDGGSLTPPRKVANVTPNARTQEELFARWDNITVDKLAEWQLTALVDAGHERADAARSELESRRSGRSGFRTRASGSVYSNRGGM
jgi:hypothetical protein